LRLLYSKVGVQYCVQCNVPITPQTEDQIADDIVRRFRDRRVSLLAPLIRARKGSHREVLERARREGRRAPQVQPAEIELSQYIVHVLSRPVY